MLRACLPLWAGWAPLLTLAYDPFASNASGAEECPCLGSLSDGEQDVLAKWNLPRDYGQKGCKAYDAGVNFTQCNGTEKRPDYCTTSWCFVNKTLCPINTGGCTAEGHRVGSYESAYCRERRMAPFHLYGIKELEALNLHYSYETCGDLNAFDAEASQMTVAGREIQMKVKASPPWVVIKDFDPLSKYTPNYGGPTFEFFLGLAKDYNPMPEMNLSAGWASDESIKLVEDLWGSSTFSSCMHDVAVGRWDVCVSDFWLTPERAQISTFMPAFRQDHFYLVVPKEKRLNWRDLERIVQWLETPFRPYLTSVWVAIVLFVVFVTMMLWITDKVYKCRHHGDEKDEENQKNLVTSSAQKKGNAKKKKKKEEDEKFLRSTLDSKIIKSLYQGFRDLFAGSSNEETSGKCHRKLIIFGFSFFLLVVLNGYSASLISFLVIPDTGRGTYQDIEMVIKEDKEICVINSLNSSFQGLYPDANFVVHSGEEEAPRLLFSKTCAAAIMADIQIEAMYGGIFKHNDCSNTSSKDYKMEHCNLEGVERNDCDLMKVGSILTSVSISLPINPSYVKSLAWATMKNLFAGQYAELTMLNKGYFPVAKCSAGTAAAELSNAQGLDIEALAGCFLIGICCIGLGIGHLVCWEPFAKNVCWIVCWVPFAKKLSTKTVVTSELEIALKS